MCGDIEDDAGLDEELMARLAANARRYIVEGPGMSGEASRKTDFSSVAGRSHYMRRLFADGLSRCFSDSRAAVPGERVDAIAAQAIVYARLAGYLAGHIPPQADLFRNLVEALGDGYAETAGSRQSDSHAHHAHGHEH